VKLPKTLRTKCRSGSPFQSLGNALQSCDLSPGVNECYIAEVLTGLSQRVALFSSTEDIGRLRGERLLIYRFVTFRSASPLPIRRQFAAHF
jgi:hypothetical protein